MPIMQASPNDYEFVMPSDEKSSNPNSKDLSIRSQEHISLLIDRSMSMAGAMLGSNGKSRLILAVECCHAIVETSSPAFSCFSIITFSDSPTLIQTKTNDPLTLEMSLGRCTSIQGGTTLAPGLLTCINQSSNRIILLSDGGVFDPQECEVQADNCVTLGIKIDTIGIGEADKAFLEGLSKKTGGRSTFCENPDQLMATFLSLETRIRFQIEDKREIRL